MINFDTVDRVFDFGSNEKQMVMFSMVKRKNQNATSHDFCTWQLQVLKQKLKSNKAAGRLAAKPGLHHS